MSVNFDLTLQSNDVAIVKLNFTGFKGGVVTKEDLKMTIFAYKPNTGEPIFTATMPFHDIKILYDYLKSISLIKDSRQKTTIGFVEASRDILEIINASRTIGPESIKPLLSKIASDDKIVELLEALNESELTTLNAAHNQHQYKKQRDIFEKMIDLDCKDTLVAEASKDPDLKIYKAGQPEKIFQNWFENNLWVFGIEYSNKHDARKIALFSEADILMESLDGYLDLIELKRPQLPGSIFSYDKNHKCYHPSSSLSEVIGQSLFYLQKMADYKLVLEKEYKVKVLQPRVKIIIGRSNKFDDEQFESLRMLNSSLSNIQILTFDYILSCCNKIIKSYDD